MSSTPNSGLAIEASGLSKAFRSVMAVRDLTLRIPHGSVFGLIGPNGAGKSTTIKMLMGMLRPTEGRPRVLGLDVLDQPVAVKQRVGYVPESHHIYRWMRVEQVISFCRALYNSWNEEFCRQMLALFELDPRKKVKHLSRGMQVKLALLLAVSHEPEVLILDEPMAGLDPLAREEFLEGVLRTICDRNQTVLFSTHTLDDVQRLADTVGILFEGRMLVHRKLDDLLASTKRIRAVLADGCRLEQFPDDVIWHRSDGREWLVTIGEFTLDKVQQIRSRPGVGESHESVPRPHKHAAPRQACSGRSHS